MLGAGRDPIFPSDTDSVSAEHQSPTPDVSLEYELVTFMAVFLGGLHGVYIRHFPDPLLSREDGNPLGWLARRRIASGRGFERYQTDMIWFRSNPSQGTRVVLMNQTKTVVK
jgi:hypothetical protein